MESPITAPAEATIISVGSVNRPAEARAPETITRLSPGTRRPRKADDSSMAPRKTMTYPQGPKPQTKSMSQSSTVERRSQAPSRRRARRWALRLAPVAAVPREHGPASGRLGRPIQRVGGRAPHGIVGRRAMGLERGFVFVDLVEVVDVLVLRVLQHVEPQAPELVPLGAERIVLDGLQEALTLPWLDARLHPDRQHRGLLAVVRLRAAPGGPRRFPMSPHRGRGRDGRPSGTSSAHCRDRPRACARCRAARRPAWTPRPERSRGPAASLRPPGTRALSGASGPRGGDWPCPPGDHTAQTRLEARKALTSTASRSRSPSPRA